MMRRNLRVYCLGLTLVGLMAIPATTCYARRKYLELDVPYVQTPQSIVDKMLEMAQVTKDDVVYDLGCGDGRIVVTAAQKHGARGVGVDIDPARIKEANANAEKAKVSERVQFVQQDLFETDFSEATVVTMYLLPDVNLRLRPKLLTTLNPGDRVVSHAFDMGEWKPDQREEVMWDHINSPVYFWVIPADTKGRWNLTIEGLEPAQQMVLELKQRFQQVSGTAQVGERQVPLTETAVKGTTFSFELLAKPEPASTADAPQEGATPENPSTAEAAGAATKFSFAGTVSGNKMTGTVTIEGGPHAGQHSWTASRPTE